LFFVQISGLMALFRTRLSRIMAKWGITSIWQFIAINLVFAFTGFSILYLKDILYGWLGLDEAGLLIKAFVFILMVVPLYNITLLFWGVILFQFQFFWAYEKRFIARIQGLFRSRKQKRNTENTEL
jgi:spore maturation protein SpmB